MNELRNGLREKFGFTRTELGKCEVEKQYELVYEQPYEYDDKSPSGFGDHGIGYSRVTYLFRSVDDFEAASIVEDFLSKGVLEFGDHWGSPPAGAYLRRFVSLHEVHDKREVKVRVQL